MLSQCFFFFFFFQVFHLFFFQLAKHAKTKKEKFTAGQLPSEVNQGWDAYHNLICREEAPEVKDDALSVRDQRPQLPLGPSAAHHAAAAVSCASHHGSEWCREPTVAEAKDRVVAEGWQVDHTSPVSKQGPSRSSPSSCAMVNVRAA
jgi:hypothetical protein